MRASEAVRFALGLLEDEFNQPDAASKEFPPEISFSHLRSSENAKHPTFEGLEAKIVPVFPIERSIKIKEYSVRRRQVPICPAFSLTDYKVQGSTLMTAVLDIKNDPTAKSQDGHKKFYSLYVQLSQLRSLNGLHLLQEIDMNNLRYRPHDGLVMEMERLRQLEQATIASWARQGHTF